LNVSVLLLGKQYKYYIVIASETETRRVSHLQRSLMLCCLR